MKLTTRQLRHLISEVASSKQDTVLVTFIETREGGDVVDGMEDDEWPDYEETNVSIEITGAYLNSHVQGTNVAEIRVAKRIPHNTKTVYVVLSCSNDADTFNTVNGTWDEYNSVVYASKKAADDYAAEINGPGATGRWHDEWAEVQAVPVRG